MKEDLNKEDEEYDSTIRDWNNFKSDLERFYGKDYRKEMHGCVSWFTTNLEK